MFTGHGFNLLVSPLTVNVVTILEFIRVKSVTHPSSLASGFGHFGGVGVDFSLSLLHVLSPLALEVNTVISAIQFCGKQGQGDDFIHSFVHSNTSRSWNEMVAGTRFCGGTKRCRAGFLGDTLEVIPDSLLQARIQSQRSLESAS